MKQADEGMKELKASVDTLIAIPNQRLLSVAGRNSSILETFKKAEDVLLQAVRGISDLITVHGLINLDFADVRTIMSEMGMAMMGAAIAQGENRAVEAAQKAISSPLLEEVSIKGARGVLINITGGPDLSLHEVNEADAHPGGGGRGGQHHLRRRHRRVDGRRGAHHGDRDGLQRARGGRREAPARPARGAGSGGRRGPSGEAPRAARRGRARRPDLAAQAAGAARGAARCAASGAEGRGRGARRGLRRADLPPARRGLSRRASSLAPEAFLHEARRALMLASTCARRGEGMPPAAPDPRLTRASLVATSPRRPRARAEAAGVAAEGIPSPRRVPGQIRCGRRAAGGAATGEPPQLPRAPAAHGGTCRPTARAGSEGREPGAAPPPPAR